MQTENGGPHYSAIRGRHDAAISAFDLYFSVLSHAELGCGKGNLCLHRGLNTNRTAFRGHRRRASASRDGYQTLGGVDKLSEADA